MDEQVFLELCAKQGYDESSKEIFKLALSWAKKEPAQKRLSGDSLLDHYLRATAILADSKSSPEIITAALLQGLLKKLPEGLPEGIAITIEKTFGQEVVHLLQGLETLREIKFKNCQMESEALRKIILTTLKDVRVILIKLTNKLDNLQDLQVLPAEEQKRIAEEVLEVYAPLAYRLGAEKIKNQLEDSAFFILEPAKYQAIATFLEESSEQREEDLREVIEVIKEVTAGKITLSKIKGRSKHIYSIYKKLVHRGVPLNEMYDFLGVRLIVEEIKDCYILLGLLHEKFEPIEGRLKDYIANPKPNFYRSIHTAVRLNPEFLKSKAVKLEGVKMGKVNGSSQTTGKVVEIQIRTPEMDEFSEEGIAAHWRYKNVKSEEAFEKKTAWLRSILDLHNDIQKNDFLEALKVDVFGDKIYCYTPKGDVRELPQGATLIDFAYLIHKEIGDHIVGGRINGKFVPLKQLLASGDVVEIITNKHQRPRRSWLKIVKSGKARQNIRKSLKEHELLPALHYRLLKPVVKEEQGVLVNSEEFPTAICTFAKCCSALPTDEKIVGIFTKRRVISIHKQDCRTAVKEQKRWIPVQWRDTFNQKIRFYVQAAERSGILADLLHTIAGAGFGIQEAKAKLVGPGNAECSFLVIPKDLEHLRELVKRVRKVRGVKKVYFE